MNTTGTSSENATEVSVEVQVRRELFLIVWHSWTPEKHHPEELRVWGIYSDEAESKRALEEARRYENHPSLKGGGFTWERVDRVDKGPDWGELFGDFGVLKCSQCGEGFKAKLNVRYSHDWKCRKCEEAQ